MNARMTCTVALLTSVTWAVIAAAQIDPRERYGTYLGGSLAYELDEDVGVSHPPSSTAVTAVINDGSGNVYVAGATSATDFPTTSGAYRRTANISQDDFNGQHSDDTFLAKFDNSGHLLWSTYLGVPTGILTRAPVYGGITGIALDTSGNAYLSGSAQLGGFGRYPQTTPFLLKVNSTGSALLFKYLVAPGCGDLGTVGTGDAVAVDSAGFAYLLGADLYQCVQPTSGANRTGNSFLIKLDTTKAPSQAVVYRAKVVDFTTASGVPFFAHALATSGTNAFVAGDFASVYELNSTGAVTFSTFYGEEGDKATAVKVNSSGGIFLAGLIGQYNSVFATSDFGNDDTGTKAFLMRIDSTGRIIYSAVLHDSNIIPTQAALDSAGEMFLTGRLTATGLRVNGYSNAPFSGAFLLRLNASGTRLWLYSAFGGDNGYAISVDKAWNAWVVGNTLPSEYYPLRNAYQSSFKGAAYQGFVSKLIIEADVKMLIQGASPNPVKHGSNLTYTLAVFNNGPDVSNGDTITDVLPTGTTFVSYSTTTGTCTHPAVGSGGTFKCTRTSALNKGSYWGPITLTVKVNALAGTTLKNTASVAAKTQDVFSSNNSSSISIQVQ